MIERAVPDKIRLKRDMDLEDCYGKITSIYFNIYLIFILGNRF